MNGIDGLNPDFRDMVTALCDAGAEFLVVGAFAVSFHGHPRTTGDMDVWVRPSAANASRVIAALQDFGAPIAALGIVVEDFERPDVVVQIGVAPPLRAYCVAKPPSPPEAPQISTLSPCFMPAPLRLTSWR